MAKISVVSTATEIKRSKMMCSRPEIFVCPVRKSSMGPYLTRQGKKSSIMPPKRKISAGKANAGSDVEDEPTVKQAAAYVGFYDNNIDPKLYLFWRQKHRAGWSTHGLSRSSRIMKL